MKKILSLFSGILITSAAIAQISQGGRPMALDSHRDLAEATFITMPAVDVEALQAEDAVTDMYKDIPYRFGHNIPVNIGMDQWTSQTFEDGSRLMRLGIECAGAVSVNFTFSQFDVPKGAKLFVYDADQTHFIGSFTADNMQSHGGLAISLIFSDKIVLEYYEPAKYVGMGQLLIDNVTHGYRPMMAALNADRGPFGNSGSCNINVACPLGDDWQDQIRSVAMIVVNNNASCSGSMVNNTAEDGTPYFLTANHCTPGNNNYNNWVFYFNHQSANCSGNSGPTNQTISGATFKAKNAGSDFALIELNDTPPTSYDVYYNGWDNNDVAATSAVGIHHPSGDVKKISRDADAVVSSVDGGAQTWRVLDWDEGTTEGGSSGSPLFNQNGHVIGQLYGGFAACGNDLADWYGKFAVSWDGSSASTRLKDWLDPLNSGATVLNGLGGAPLLANDASLQSINNIPEVTCGSTINPTITIRNNGTEPLVSLTINWTLDGNPGTQIDWTGNLTNGQTEIVDLPAMTPGDGDHTLVVVASNPNGNSDGNVANNTISKDFIVFEDAVEYLLSITLDEYGSETTWELSDDSNNVIYTGGPYADDADQSVEEENLCLGNGCYTFTIMDAWGDGICCEFGIGSYTVYDNLGNALFTGGEFQDDESNDFCVVAASVEEDMLLAGFNVFPNPSKNHVYLNIPDLGIGKYVVEIMDVTGRTVHTEQLMNAANNYVVNTSNFTNGIYLVRLSHGNATAVKQLVIAK
jgi:lysyl endopeptidase